jgi:oligopeptidase A
MTNPLLEGRGLPAFTSIRAEHVEPAVRAVIERNRQELASALAAPMATWDSVVVPVEEMQHRLARTFSPVGHLNAVVNTEALRAAYTACLPLLTDWHTDLVQSAGLNAAYQSVLEQDSARLGAPERRLLENALRDFRLAGVALPPERKLRFKACMERLATLQSKFDDNVLDATNAWSHHTDDVAELAGLPSATVERARTAAAIAGRSGWLLPLDAPTYQAVLTHAQHRSLRQSFYEAWTTRASDAGPHAGRWDNSVLMREILALRHEIATLTGLRNFAQYSLATKMAPDVSTVIDFLVELAGRFRPVAQQEFAELEQFAGCRLEAWDVPFQAERLKRERLAISEEALRPYFPLPRVLTGLFELATRLYGIRIVERPYPEIYHPDVRFFEVHGDDGQLRGCFFLDLYARPHKRGGAWMDECVGRKRLVGEHVRPVAYIVCNFMPPVGARPSLLTHQEVVTLFHEFGHGLHHMLTRIDFPSIAGINGVPWDAVELPSQFMENFAWHAAVLPLISGHIDDGRPLPAGELARLQRSRTFHAGLQGVRQLEFALFDFRLHAEYDPARPADVHETLAAVRAAVSVVPVPTFNRFAHSFQHVFSGGYAAGYYSYKWAEVLAADAFSAFEEYGVFDTDTAHRFLGEILERGGSRDALEAFVAFRGREPSIEALLRQTGLAA